MNNNNILLDENRMLRAEFGRLQRNFGLLCQNHEQSGMLLKQYEQIAASPQALQQHLAFQHRNLESEKQQHAVANQSLRCEHALRNETEKRLAEATWNLNFERSVITQLVLFINGLRIPQAQRAEFMVPEGMGIGDLICAREAALTEVETLKAEVAKLQNKSGENTGESRPDEGVRLAASTASSDCSSLTSLSESDDMTVAVSAKRRRTDNGRVSS